MTQSVLDCTALSVADLYRGLALSYASFHRWRRRLAQGLPVVRPPGPSKVGPLPLDPFQDEVTIDQEAPPAGSVSQINRMMKFGG